MTDCPVPIGRYDHVVLGHGAGGRLSSALLSEVFLPAFDDPVLRRLEDQATLPVAGGRIAVTTDAFVVTPVEFTGGDIGSLAVCGTINDLAAGGAVPRWLTAAFVLEEGLPFDRLRRIVGSMAATCAAAGVALVAGDTKVVERGKADQIFITTTGVGVVPDGVALSWHAARPGDRVIVTGPIGDHGIAILALRHQLGLEPAIASDSAPLHELARAVLAEHAPHVRGMRDPTRGGVASALVELAIASQVGVELDETALPVRPPVRAVCEILGLDPLYVACEGRFVIVVAPDAAGAVLATLRRHPLGEAAVLVGTVTERHAGTLVLRQAIGTARIVPLLGGDQLPRIC